LTYKWVYLINIPLYNYSYVSNTSHRDRRDRIVVGFTTTCAISAYHHSIKLKTTIHNRGRRGHCRMVDGFITTYLSPPTLWVRIPHRWDVLDKTLCDKVCQWLATGRWFSPGTPVFSTNKTERHDITEILLKVALNTIKQT
jgi:hypothetical protein